MDPVEDHIDEEFCYECGLAFPTLNDCLTVNDERYCQECAMLNKPEITSGLYKDDRKSSYHSDNLISTSQQIANQYTESGGGKDFHHQKTAEHIALKKVVIITTLPDHL